MAYTPATSLPTYTLFQWGTIADPNPTLAAPLQPGDTTVYFSSPPYDHAGNIITGNFPLGIKNSSSYVMNCWIPAGGVAADGLSATIVQGIRLEGLDYTTGDASLIPDDGFSAGDSIFCNVSGVVGALLTGAIRGVIATNGLGFIMGDGTNGNATISQKDASSTKGFLRKNPTSGKVQYSNDGSTWVNIDSVSASNLVTVSAADTTPGYLNDKVTVTSGSGATVTKSITSPAGNEKLNIDVALDVASIPAIADHAIYTPAFLTGDTGAQGTFSNWLAVLDGSFRITINGVARNVDAINFTGVASMADVATKIQTALRAVTSSAETVVWSTNRFIITSADTTSSSAITVTTTSTGTVGTDISGAGAADWMDCDTGNGVVTNAVLNYAADAGKIVKLGATGHVGTAITDDVVAKAAYTAKGDIMAATAADTPARFAAGADGTHLTYQSGEASGLKAIVPYATGQTSRSSGAGTGTQNIAHGLGVIPKLVKITAAVDINGGGNACYNSSFGTATAVGSQSATVARWISGIATAPTQSNSNIIYSTQTSGAAQVVADMSALDATNITLNFTTMHDTVYIQWEAYA